MQSAMPILRVSVQPSKAISLKRVDDGWLLWVAGSPESRHSTYLHLHDSGRVQRVTEDKLSGEVNILDVRTM